MSNTQNIKLQWTSRFPLHEAFTSNQGGGGLYLWGFDSHEGEVIWYVGKATTAKGVYRRLRKHYLDIMSGQYQIPHGFLNGKFESRRCSQSGWRIKAEDSEQAEVLRDWLQMERIFRAGHSFANKAFARVAHLDVDDTALKALERLAIQQLDPVINKQRGKSLTGDSIEIAEHDGDTGWLQRWTQKRAGDSAAGARHEV